MCDENYLTLQDKFLGKTIRRHFGSCAACAHWERNVPPKDVQNGICLAGRGETVETEYYYGRCFTAQTVNIKESDQ